MGSDIARVVAPTPEEKDYWSRRSWKHTGLGFFLCLKTGIRGRIIRYKDGTTGMMWAPRRSENVGGGCIIKYLERQGRAA